MIQVLTATDPASVPSVAIPIYLSANYQTADHRYPADLQAHAHIREYLGWHADFIRGTFSVPLWVQVRRAIWGVIDCQGPGRR